MYSFRSNSRRNNYDHKRKIHYKKSSMPTFAWFVKTGFTEPDHRQELQATLKDIKEYLVDCGCNKVHGSLSDEEGVIRIFYVPSICNADILEEKLKKNFPYEWIRREKKAEEDPHDVEEER